MRFQQERAREWVPGAAHTVTQEVTVDRNNDTPSVEVRTLTSIVEALDSVFYGSVAILDGAHLNRLSEARAEAAFLLDRAQRQAGREVVAA